MVIILLSEQTEILLYTSLKDWILQPKRRVFTARYGLSPYKSLTRYVLKGLKSLKIRFVNSVEIKNKTKVYHTFFSCVVM